MKFSLIALGLIGLAFGEIVTPEVTATVLATTETTKVVVSTNP